MERSHSDVVTLATRLPFSPSPQLLSPRLHFIRVMPSSILRRSSRYSGSTTVCRLSLQNAMQLPLSNSFPSRRALSWRVLLPVSPAGLVDPGSRNLHGPFCNSFLSPDARVLPPHDDAVAAFFVWYSQLGTGTHRIIDYVPATTIFSVPSLTTVNERYFGASARRACRADYQAWLLAQTTSQARRNLVT